MVTVRLSYFLRVGVRCVVSGTHAADWPGIALLPGLGPTPLVIESLLAQVTTMPTFQNGI